MSQRVYDRRDLEMVLRRGFVFQGGLRGAPRRRIEPAAQAGPVDVESLIYAIQNHDFIGNHPLGLRLHQLTSDAAHRAAAALLVMYPAIPMLFMGEEFASEHPFFFFVDYRDDHLREAVERGRRAEYPQHDWTGGASPLNPESFTRSRIGPRHDGNLTTFAWYQALLALRKAWKAVGGMHSEQLRVEWHDAQGLALLRYTADRGRFVAVRLHASDEKPTPVALRVRGEVDIEQETEPHGNEYRLHTFGVLIGEGEVELLH